MFYNIVKVYILDTQLHQSQAQSKSWDNSRDNRKSLLVIWSCRDSPCLICLCLESFYYQGDFCRDKTKSEVIPLLLTHRKIWDVSDLSSLYNIKQTPTLPFPSDPNFVY